MEGLEVAQESFETLVETRGLVAGDKLCLTNRCRCYGPILANAVAAALVLWRALNAPSR